MRQIVDAGTPATTVGSVELDALEAGHGVDRSSGLVDDALSLRKMASILVRHPCRRRLIL
jgi:hypothetical protein